MPQFFNKTAQFVSAICLSTWLGPLPFAAAQDSVESGIKIDFSGYADARIVQTSDEEGWLNGGLGKGRFSTGEAENSEIQPKLAELALMARAQFTWNLSGFAHIQYSPEQTKAVDVVEAFLEYKPLARPGLRLKGKLGLFYPPISMEHTDIGWTSPYSLTPSAINGWIGEEVKSFGAEIRADRNLGDFNLSAVLGGFILNDTTTSLLAWRGWAMHDHKVSLFQRYPIPLVASIDEGGMFHGRQAPWTEPHLELDSRPGYYVGINWDYLGLFRVQGLYYDNRADPTVLKNLQYAWDSRFYSLGAYAAPTENLELIAQYMTGNTLMGPVINGEIVFDMDYDSYFLLASMIFDEHRISARYDKFSTTDNNVIFLPRDNNNEDGKAFTLAYSYSPAEGHRIMAEWLYIDSDRVNRADFNLPTRAKETQLQISYRLSF